MSFTLVKGAHPYNTVLRATQAEPLGSQIFFRMAESSQAGRSVFQIWSYKRENEASFKKQEIIFFSKSPRKKKKKKKARKEAKYIFLLSIDLVAFAK